MFALIPIILSWPSCHHFGLWLIQFGALCPGCTPFSFPDHPRPPLSPSLEKCHTSFPIEFSWDFLLIYRDGLKGGPVLLSNSRAGPGRNLSQPRAHLIVHLCIQWSHLLTLFVRQTNQVSERWVITCIWVVIDHLKGWPFLIPWSWLATRTMFWASSVQPQKISCHTNSRAGC